MARKRHRLRSAKTRALKIIGLSILVFAFGYYILNYVATWEKPPLGSTFCIIAGCILIAASVIVIAVTLKGLYFPRKKKKGTRPVFLTDLQKKNKQLPS